MTDQRVGLRIHRTGGVIKDQDLRLLEKRSRDTESLLLTTGHVVTALHDHRIVFIRKFLNEAVRLGQLTYSLHFLVAGVLITPADIFINASRKQDIFLQHHGHLVTQCLQIILAHIHAADLHAAAGHVVKTRDELHKRGLGTSRTADNTDDLTALNMKVYIF